MSYDTQWGTIDDRDIEIAILLGAGATQQAIADHLHVSGQAISKRVSQKAPDFYQHFAKLSDLGKKALGVGWQEKMRDRYFGMWEKSLNLVEQAIDEGDLKTAKATLKDILDHELGLPTRRVEVKGSVSGTVRHEHALPEADLAEVARMIQNQRALLTGEVIDVEPID